MSYRSTDDLRKLYIGLQHEYFNKRDEKYGDDRRYNRREMSKFAENYYLPRLKILDILIHLSLEKGNIYTKIDNLREDIKKSIESGDNKNNISTDQLNFLNKLYPEPLLDVKEIPQRMFTEYIEEKRKPKKSKSLKRCYCKKK